MTLIIMERVFVAALLVTVPCFIFWPDPEYS